MSPTEKKRFLFINFSMLSINSCSDDVYEALADNNIEEALSAIDALITLSKDLRDSISGDN
tara:strand:- start:1136 stop:1318 length:183 start_codon:yes stop_codon:yes gene_type:complete